MGAAESTMMDLDTSQARYATAATALTESQVQLRRGAAIRRTIEADETFGKRVWYARRVVDGNLREFGLVTYGTSHVLKAHKHDSTSQPPSVPFSYEAKQCNIRRERGSAEVSALGSADNNGYYICLIGWTHLSKQAVSEVFQKATNDVDDQAIPLKDGRRLLRQITRQILVLDKAIDYTWFKADTDDHGEKGSCLVPPPEALKLNFIQERLEEEERLHWTPQLQQQVNGKSPARTAPDYVILVYGHERVMVPRSDFPGFIDVGPPTDPPAYHGPPVDHHPPGHHDPPVHLDPPTHHAPPDSPAHHSC